MISRHHLHHPHSDRAFSLDAQFQVQQDHAQWMLLEQQQQQQQQQETASDYATAATSTTNTPTPTTRLYILEFPLPRMGRVLTRLPIHARLVLDGTGERVLRGDSSVGASMQGAVVLSHCSLWACVVVCAISIFACVRMSWNQKDIGYCSVGGHHAGQPYRC